MPDKQMVMLNKQQLIQLSGLAAGADGGTVIIEQTPSGIKSEFLASPLLITRFVKKEKEQYMMTWTGLYQKTGE